MGIDNGGDLRLTDLHGASVAPDVDPGSTLRLVLEVSEAGNHLPLAFRTSNEFRTVRP